MWFKSYKYLFLIIGVLLQIEVGMSPAFSYLHLTHARFWVETLVWLGYVYILAFDTESTMCGVNKYYAGGAELLKGEEGR